MFSWRNKNKKQTNAAIENTSPDRYLDLAKANDNKRKIIFSLIILQLFSLMIIGQLSFKNSIRTYVIEKITIIIQYWDMQMIFHQKCINLMINL